MNFKKMLCFFVIFLIIFSYNFSFADDFLDDNFELCNFDVNVSSNISNLPDVNARHAVVFDRASKTILFGKGENEKCKMASTTKIMTAIVVIENCSDLSSLVTVSKKAARYRWL